MRYALIYLYALLQFSGWGNHACAQTNLLAQARWISADYTKTVGAAVFAKSFIAQKGIRSAKLYITAHGIYEARLNGKRIGEAYFAPGYTSYGKRLQYQVYDVKNLLKHSNKLHVTVAGGWYSGVFGGDMQAGNYGKEISLLCLLEITYANGKKQVINSDSGWKVGSGPISSTGFYSGELQDTRIEEGNWSAVKILEFDSSNLVPTIAPPVTAQERFSPRRIFRTPKGEQVLDFGQNMAGVVQLTIQSKSGDTIRVEHAEMLDQEGNFYTGNLREAKATDIYVLNGKPQVLMPHFTYHGFRYIKVTGITATKSNCTAVALHTALRHTGTFSCSDPLINQLQHNIIWSLNSNFVDIPTDCPQRSERLGWTGDAQVFCATAAFNRDVDSFYTKWLADLAADQGTNGGLPNIIPDVYGHAHSGPKNGAAGWGDAAAIVPWTLYERYGNKDILVKQYASMKAWVGHLHSLSHTDLSLIGSYGDWYAPGDSTSISYIDQCFYVHSLEFLNQTAKLLKHDADAILFADWLQKAKVAFINTYVLNGLGMVKATDTQTACILALQFELLPDGLRGKVAARLVELIHSNGDHLATGFLGTPFLLPVLTANGYTDVAYQLLKQQTCPSWLYPITKGATTIWEKWDAVRPDGTLQETSFNHYAYGAVGQWLYETVAGIRPAAPGFKKMVIAPQPGGGLTWCKASYDCPFGKIVFNWAVKNKQLVMDITIPAHTTATVNVPDGAIRQVGPGHYRFTSKYSNK